MSEVVDTEKFHPLVNLSKVEELERQRNDAKDLIHRRQAALRLANNPDFRLLILDGFCRDETARYAHLSTDPALTPEQRADALGVAQASGYLKRYLSITVQMGAHAEREMPELEEAIDQARAEENEG